MKVDAQQKKIISRAKVVSLKRLIKFMNPIITHQSIKRDKTNYHEKGVSLQRLLTLKRLWEDITEIFYGNAFDNIDKNGKLLKKHKLIKLTKMK